LSLIAATQLVNSDIHKSARRFALFLSMLISGGLMVFPREPILLLIILACLKITQMRLSKLRQIWPLLLLLATILVVTLVRPGPVSFASLVSRFTNYLAALLMLQVYLHAPEGALMKDLRVLLFPMVLQAIATVVLAHSMGALFMPVSIGEQGYFTFVGLFNYHITIDGLSSVIRPDGFFFEPGVFQVYLNLYLYLALFAFHNLRRAGLAVLAVLSTQSTTGLLICMILLSTWFIQHVATSTLRRKVAAACLALVLAPPMLYMVHDNITDKLSGTTQGSSWAREYDLFTGLRIVAENPWLGIGFEVDRYLAASGRLGYEGTLLTSSQMQERPTSNGILQLFYSLGIPLALPFLIGIFRQRLFRHRTLIGLWLMLSLFGEALLFTPFFLFVVFSAFLGLPLARMAWVGRGLREPMHGAAV
jgi:hypothetical protein